MRRLTAALAAAALAALALTAAVERAPSGYRAAGIIELTRWPYFPGSVIPVRVDGFPVPYHLALEGAGRIGSDGVYEIPNGAVPGQATLVAGNASGLAARTLRVAVPPEPASSFLAVASYDDGVFFHDVANFGVLGVLATGGTPSDAAFDRRGRLTVTDTQGAALTVAALAPWRVSRIDGVPFGDEIAFDETTQATFVTNRDVAGSGALTRVARDGSVSRVATGATAEGLAVDERRQIVYVANVNDDTVAAVDAASMRVIRRFHAVARIFSLALSPDGKFLYGISNQSASSPFAAAGSAVRIELAGNPPRVVARSGKLAFPLGVALDASGHTLFVTDESLDTIDVLDPVTLRAKHAPVPTCRTPWKPLFDAASGRLYVPCARADEVDVIDTRTLRRAAGAPFATGSYPLAVTVWHAAVGANRSSYR